MDDLVQTGKQLTEHLINSVPMALQDPGSWVGYALLEMGGDFLQEQAEEWSPVGWEDESKSVARGFMSDVKMTYAHIRHFEHRPGVATNVLLSGGTSLFAPKV